MADYSDPDEPLGGWDNFLKNKRLKELVDRIQFRYDTDTRMFYCDYCGAVLATQTTGAQEAHKKFHADLFRRQIWG